MFCGLVASLLAVGHLMVLSLAAPPILVNNQGLPAPADIQPTVSQKVCYLLFDNNFGKCGPIFQILYQLIRKNVLSMQHKDFHLNCNMLLHYHVKFENPKMLQNFHVECDNMFA